jgi:hypothetical protein
MKQKVAALMCAAFPFVLFGMTSCVDYQIGPTPCTKKNQDRVCGDFFCVDGFCCNSVCNGTCQACNLPGYEGNCYGIPDGEDPEDDCSECQVCDGQGACRDVPAGEDTLGDCDQWDESTCGLNGICDGAGKCANYGPDTECDDQDLCTYNDHCDGQGNCSGTAITCQADPGSCAFQPICNGTDTCTGTYPGEDTACDDQDLCTYDDRCDSQGGCAGASIICDDDPSPCGANRECDGTDTCTVSYPSEEITCDDNLFCTIGDHCDGLGACMSGSEIPCESGEACFENERVCCIVEDYLACGSDGNIYWFDSCNHQGDIYQECPAPNGECQDGACHCHNHWTSNDCQTCPPHWDASQDCAVCLGNWDPTLDCLECLPHWIGEDCELRQCVRYVDINSTADLPDGTSWSSAFTTVQDGIDAAHDVVQDDPEFTFCEVWVAQGTYFIFTSSYMNTVQLRPWVHLYGGFTGTEVLLEQRDWENNFTTLDGHASQNSDRQVCHVVTGGSDTLIDGFTITGGYIDMQFCDFETWGAGLLIGGESITVANCAIINNFSSDCGPGVKILGGNVHFFNTVVRDNSARHNGAIDVVGGSASFDSCKMNFNTSSLNGGGLSASGSTIHLSNCEIIGNSITGGEGAGVKFHNSSAVVENCRIQDNSNTGKGGGIALEASANAVISNTIISGNHTQGDGGGLYLEDSSAELTNCMITSNSASGMGGGIHVQNANLTATNCTIAANTSSTSGGIECALGAGIILTNSVLWNDNQDEISCSATGDLNSLTISYTDIQGGSSSISTGGNTTVDWGDGNLNDDPLFLDPVAFDYHLTQGSPCIDTATSNVAPSFDFELDARPWGSGFDIGADEYTGSEN